MCINAENKKKLPLAAQRALQEALLRRESIDNIKDSSQEVGGRGGQDPVRYGDWEINGRAIDF